MTRSLAQQSGLLNDHETAKATLVGQLNAMKGVCTSPLPMLVLDIHLSSFMLACQSSYSSLALKRPFVIVPLRQFILKHLFLRKIVSIS